VWTNGQNVEAAPRDAQPGGPPPPQQAAPIDDLPF